MLWAGGSVGKIANDLADLRDREAAAAWGIPRVTAYDGHRAMLSPGVPVPTVPVRTSPSAPTRARTVFFLAGIVPDVAIGPLRLKLMLVTTFVVVNHFDCKRSCFLRG
jgi:hypothetical protein